MADPKKLPVPSGDQQAEPLRMSDPATGDCVPVGDMRAEFERLSRQTPRDPRAQRAFIESKIEIVRSDPNLTEIEKERAIQELRRLL